MTLHHDEPNCGLHRHLTWTIAMECLNKRHRATLEQIRDVCDDNMSDCCNHAMALNFVRGVADNALNNEQLHTGETK